MSSTTSSFMKFMQMNLFMLATFGEDCYDYTRLLADSAVTCGKSHKIDSATASSGGDFAAVCEQLCTDMMADRGVECTHFGIDTATSGVCVFYDSCDEARTAKKTWDTYEKYAVECPEEPAADALPESGVSDAPIDTGAGPLPEVGPAPDDAYPVTEPMTSNDASLGGMPAPVEMPQHAYVLNMVGSRRVCSPVFLIGTACTGCMEADCETACSDDENCEYFGFSATGGLCYLYDSCAQTVMMGLKFDTYKKTHAAPMPDVPAPSTDVLGGDLSGQAPVPEDAPAPGGVNPDAAPAPGGPGLPSPTGPGVAPGNPCDPTYEVVTATELSSTTCAKDWILGRKYNENASVNLCAIECTNDSACKFFGLSTIGTCVLFSGCETTRVTGKTWTTYERIESTDPACSVSSDASACDNEPYTTEVFMGPDAPATCKKSMMVRKEANGGATEADCRLACEVQHKTWAESDDVGQCEYFALSDKGVCILYEDCSGTRYTNTFWTTWKMTPPACANDAIASGMPARRRRSALELPAPMFRRFNL